MYRAPDVVDCHLILFLRFGGPPGAAYGPPNHSACVSWRVYHVRWLGDMADPVSLKTSQQETYGYGRS
ncbi:hypothetical protein EMCRGX_G033182 [Ephydatia muelleri]